MSTLTVVQPEPSAYAEHEVHDDLAARAVVFRVAVEVYRHTRSEAQTTAMLASLSFRMGQPFRLGHHTFTLHNPTGDRL